VTETIKIATWNVNSIKARLHAVDEWLKETNPDIVLLQELKCVTEAFPYEQIEDLGYNVAAHGQKSYNGVAILSKYPIDEIIKELPPLSNEDEKDEQARYIEALIYINEKVLKVASVYVPNGNTVGSDKFLYKMKFFDRLRKYYKDISYIDDTAFIIGGDFNVGPEDIDVYDPKSLRNTICFHPEEQQKYRSLINTGLTELFREFNPDIQQFSWWDYRGGGYKNGKGMRIDFLLACPKSAEASINCSIDENPRGKEKASDHTPVICTLDINKLEDSL